jgi:dTDP-4-dehydrorhamnose reductase
VKILVTGSAGLLGHDVWRLFEHKHDLMALGRTQAAWVDSPRFRSCDLTNAALTYATITKENPELVVHCAAYNDVDGAESDPDAAFRGNSLATRNVALACQRFDTTLLSVSTDYVFDGDSASSTGYREVDPCNPINTYGQSKRWAEIYIEQLLSKFFIVRTAWLFGPSRPTWVDKLLDTARQGGTFKAASDMVGSPTYTPDLAAGLLRLAESRHYGTYHLTNTGFCSRVELAEQVLALHRLDPKKSLQAVKLADLRLPAKRPHFSALDNLVWRLDGFPPMRSWQDALKEHFSQKKVSAQ